ncbi:Protein OCTOPUS-like [Dillenia turbinata]|uniref:Protein OCTOPUS-like n=1 Tax=Dillenia turbinata TaxID=194707 RepID=A0AAN8V2P8_9MAGN
MATSSILCFTRRPLLWKCGASHNVQPITLKSRSPYQSRGASRFHCDLISENIHRKPIGIKGRQREEKKHKRGIRRSEMGWSESRGGCKKHPNHIQQTGVCSLCLQERLSQLSGSNYMLSGSNYVLSCSSRYSSAISSTCNSPPSQSHRRHQRNASEATGSLLLMTNGGLMIKKSRSMAWVHDKGSDGVNGNVKKKSGFWSKLLRSNNKRTKEALRNSKTVGENLLY